MLRLHESFNKNETNFAEKKSLENSRSASSISMLHVKLFRPCEIGPKIDLAFWAQQRSNPRAAGGRSLIPAERVDDTSESDWSFGICGATCLQL